MNATSPHRADGMRFLDPAILARIGNLDLISRRVVDGFMSGMHRAANLGSSTDFAEYRAYTPGDDVRRIDWRVYGRTDRLYIKTFEAETNSDVVFALDCSASMNFASAELSKFDYARMLVASLTHLSAGQRDRVGLVTFNDEVLERIPAAVRHRDNVLRLLQRTEASGGSDLVESLKRASETLNRRGIFVVVSDFYEEPEKVAAALDEVRLRGHDVIAFHVLDRDERNLRLSDTDVLRDLETGERLASSNSARQHYEAMINDHLNELGAVSTARQVDYISLVTDEPLDTGLFNYLSSRSRFKRVR